MAVVDDLGQSGHRTTPPPSEDFGRQPPQDLAAEQSVLGGMLLSKDAIADVLERLRPGDFYRPAHQNVYDAILDLYGRGEPADAVTVAAELDRRGAAAPHRRRAVPAHADLDGADRGQRRVLRRASSPRRRCCAAWSRPAPGSCSTATPAPRAPTSPRSSTAPRPRSTTSPSAAPPRTSSPLEELLQPTMDEIDAIASSGGIAPGVPTGFTELDEVTNGLHPGQMIIVAARPGVGKSTLGLDFMRSCSIKHRMASVIFSLEMSKSEIVMRLLSAEAKIKLADMRVGPDERRRLDAAGAADERDQRGAAVHRRFAEPDDDGDPRQGAPAQAEGTICKLIVIDYLQLMTSGKKVESRQQEVSEFSRQPQAAGQGTRGAGGRDQPAEPWSGAAHRQAAAWCRTFASRDA